MANGVEGPYNADHSQINIKVITTFANILVDNACVMVGTSISVHRQLEIRDRLTQCGDALVEAHFLKPVGAGSYFVATVPIDQGKGQVVITEELSTGTPIEGNVSVAYGDAFDNVPASSLNLSVTIERFIDHLLKESMSAA